MILISIYHAVSFVFLLFPPFFGYSCFLFLSIYRATYDAVRLPTRAIARSISPNGQKRRRALCALWEIAPRSRVAKVMSSCARSEHLRGGIPNYFACSFDAWWQMVRSAALRSHALVPARFNTHKSQSLLWVASRAHLKEETASGFVIRLIYAPSGPPNPLGAI